MRKAFTLIEAMIVLAIVCIIAAIAFPTLMENRRRKEVAQADAPPRFTATNDLLSDNKHLTLYQLTDTKTGRQWLVVRCSSGTAIVETENMNVEKK